MLYILKKTNLKAEKKANSTVKSHFTQKIYNELKYTMNIQ